VASALDASRLRVLVVDDEEDLATATALRLDRRGFVASCAFSGDEALMRLADQPVDVVLLDLKMPGMDGLATLRQIRRSYPGIAVVVLTGHGTVSAGIEGMQLGATDFLRKPVPVETLCTTLRAAAVRGEER
jgi:DNA-binding response OmpR family regulator